MEWTKENTLDFIQLYEKTSVLWDPNHPQYYNKLHKHDAWEEIATAMGTVPEECKKKMTSLLSSYRREKGRIRKSRGTGKGMYVCKHACSVVILTNKNVTEIFQNHVMVRMVLFTYHKSTFT